MAHFWHVAEALLALWKHRRDGSPFTRSELVAWSEKLAARPRAAQAAIDHLADVGLLRRLSNQAGEPILRQGVYRYALTPEGRAAAKAAHEAVIQAARVEGQRRAVANRAPDPTTFQSRLWNLFRVRKVLTGPEAAETLVDAGQNVARAAITAARCLRCWHALHPQAIQVSAQRAGAAHRFVMVQDLGPVAPVIPRTLARGGAPIA